MVTRALLVVGVILVIGLFSPASSHAQGTLTLVDELFVGDGPGDLVLTVKRGVRYVISLLFNTGQAVTHRLANDGTLTEVGRTVVGPEPRGIALAHGGDLAIIANSIADELGVFEVGDDGLLREINRAWSGGQNPYDVAVARNDIVVVVNHDSDQVNTFHLDRPGRVRPIDAASAGIDPHIVTVSSRGFVGVGNQTSQDMALFITDGRGNVREIGTVPLDNETPQAAAWLRNQLFLAVDKPFPQEDEIRTYRARRNGGTSQPGDIAAGVFLTDIEANEDGVFAVTVNLNDPANPFDDRDEVRVYSSYGAELTLEAAVQTPGFPPSFKQIAIARGRDGNTHVVTTAFQGGWLRSFLWNEDGDDDNEESD